MKISGSLGLGALSPVTAERQARPIAVISSQQPDAVTFSSAGRIRAEAAAHPRWGAFSAMLHAEPDIADQLVSDFAHAAPQAVLDATEMVNNTGPIRYAATGEAYTPESKARYAHMAEGLRAASVDLFNQERAKGTDAADIFDKLIALGDSQSAEFRAMAHWDAALE